MSTKQQFFRFAAVGAFGTALHYLTLIVLVSGMAADPAKATMIGATLGAFTNYCLNYRFSFNSDRRHREALPLFLAMAGIGVLLNGAIVKVFTWFEMNYLLAQIVATLAILGLNFFGSRKWIFSKVK